MLPIHGYIFDLQRSLEIRFTHKLKEEDSIIFSLIEKVDHAIKMVETGVQGEVFLYSFAIFFYLELCISIKIIHKFVTSYIKCFVRRGDLFKIIDYVILNMWI